jgi:phage-related protein
MGVITFNGITSSSLGIVVEEPPAYNFPKKDYEVTHIPGRDGDIIIDNGSYQNVKREYKIAMGDEELDFMSQVPSISQWLHSASGYAKLSDTYDPDHYRMAAYDEDGEVENILGHAGRATISFTCKPQRFRTSGDRTMSWTPEFSSETKVWRTLIENPTSNKARPIIVLGFDSSAVSTHILNLWITVWDSRQAVLRGGIEINITGTENNTGYIYIDCGLFIGHLEIQNGESTTFRHLPMSITNDFPFFIPGNYNELVVQDNNYDGTKSIITSVEVTPKWWDL